MCAFMCLCVVQQRRQQLIGCHTHHRTHVTASLCITYNIPIIDGRRGQSLCLSLSLSLSLSIVVSLTIGYCSRIIASRATLVHTKQASIQVFFFDLPCLTFSSRKAIARIRQTFQTGDKLVSAVHLE